MKDKAKDRKERGLRSGVKEKDRESEKRERRKKRQRETWRQRGCREIDGKF